MQFKVGTHGTSITRSDTPWFARIIELHADASSTGEVRRAIVYFYGPETNWPITMIGHQVPLPDGRGYIVAEVPLVDFADHCRLLESGRPVLVTWEVDGRDQQLRAFSLSTEAASVGEGIVDYKPPVIPGLTSQG